MVTVGGMEVHVSVSLLLPIRFERYMGRMFDAFFYYRIPESDVTSSRAD